MAMGWLWTAYWETVQARFEKEGNWAIGGESEEQEAEEEEDRETRADYMKALLSEWMETQSENQLRNGILLLSADTNAATIATGILQALGPVPARSQYKEVVNLLLSDTRMLAPVEKYVCIIRFETTLGPICSQHSSTVSERQKIAHWDQLLRALATAGARPFITALISGLVDRATRPASRLPTNTKSIPKSKSSTTTISSSLYDVRPRVLAWMHHLLNNPLWLLITRTCGVMQLIAQSCVERPGPYSTALGVTLVESRLWKVRSPDITGRRGTNSREQDGNEAVSALSEMVEQAESHGRQLALTKSEANLKDRSQGVESREDVAMPDAESNTDDRLDETVDDAPHRSLSPPIWATCATPIGIAPTW